MAGDGAGGIAVTERKAYVHPLYVAWSDKDVTALRVAYDSAKVATDINLMALAATLGRHKTNVCRKARALGLTDQARRKFPNPKGPPQRMYETAEELRAAQSAVTKRRIAVNGHPRGMMGKKHSAEAIAKLAVSSSRTWERMTEEDIARRGWKIAKTRAENMAAGLYVNERKGTTWKAGWREIGRHRKYFRSRWEANYARYLQFLLDRGAIADWEHEPHTFWFEGIKRGSLSYLPDFKVTNPGGSVEWHEVKGWMDDRSKTKLNRMAKYHPNEKLVLIRQKDYQEIRNKLSSLIPEWEA